MAESCQNGHIYEPRAMSTLSFQHISYKVPVESPISARCKKQTQKYKTLLNNISGLCGSGLTAVMGPTGSGKTSLLNVLAGHVNKKHVEGTVLLNGEKQSEQQRKQHTGYVLQDDNLASMLTVEENIQFAADLLLPQTLSKIQRQQKVSEVIDLLGLQQCAFSKVGQLGQQGISGGERKRCSIAMEMLHAPCVLYLDEPTSGLDASTAQSVVTALKGLSQSGRTVIFSVHQPRYSIYKHVDTLILLSCGNIVYHGSPDHALEYFTELGYVCEPHNNPADFYLDIITGVTPSHGDAIGTAAVNGHRDDKKPVVDKANDSSEQQEHTTLIIQAASLNADHQGMNNLASCLTESFKRSKMHCNLQDNLLRLHKASSQQEDTVEVKTVNTVLDTSLTHQSQQCSFIRQVMVLSRRTFQTMARNPRVMMTQVSSALIFGLLVGCIYFDVDDSYTAGIQNRVGAFFFIVMNHVFGNMSSVDLFIKERTLFIHENTSGYYRISVYLLCKLLAEVIPMKLMCSIVFCTVAYWMIGLEPSVLYYVLCTITTFLTSISATSCALVFSATCATYSIAAVLTSLIWVLMMVFGGFLLNARSVPSVLQWLEWCSIFRYGMNSLSINELKDKVFCDTLGNSTICDSGNAYLARQAIPYATSWHYWYNSLALLVITTVFLVLTYVQLRRMSKY